MNHNDNMRFNDINKLAKYARDYGHAKIKNVGYSDTEHHICTFLFFHPGVSQDDVANALIIDKTTVAKALTSLESKGQIVRNANNENRRKNRLFLTDDGKASVNDVVNVYSDWTERVTDVLTPDEKKIFFEICARLAERAKQINEVLL